MSEIVPPEHHSFCQRLLDACLDEAVSAFQAGLGWCLDERWFYPVIARELASAQFEIPEGYTRQARRIATNYPIRSFKNRKPGRPPNVDVIEVFSNHAARRRVRATGSSAVEVFRTIVEVKWITESNRSDIKAAGSDLKRLITLNQDKDVFRSVFIALGPKRDAPDWIERFRCSQSRTRGILDQDVKSVLPSTWLCSVTPDDRFQGVTVGF